MMTGAFSLLERHGHSYQQVLNLFIDFYFFPIPSQDLLCQTFYFQPLSGGWISLLV